ncbi:N-acetyltransferase [Halorubrum sp. BOL3-1]|uniref:GNAT family N-acetyltransferase n=1 Tax=Halorubrum sp. BOL3-1 TaxID=2497325 RepID=UPI001F4FC3BE|nr:GNAT family N-acetyltransferase [Halorubrum sp. BOL3-1]
MEGETAGRRQGVFVAADRTAETGTEAAAEADAVTGFVDVRWGEETTKPFVGRGEAGVKAVYVRPDRWGRGIGTAPLERGLDALPDRVDTVRLEALAENDVGAGFYEARGFERTDAIERDIAGEPRALDVWTKRV